MLGVRERPPVRAHESWVRVHGVRERAPVHDRTQKKGRGSEFSTPLISEWGTGVALLVHLRTRQTSHGAVGAEEDHPAPIMPWLQPLLHTAWHTIIHGYDIQDPTKRTIDLCTSPWL